MTRGNKIGLVLLIAFSIFFFGVALFDDSRQKQWWDVFVGVACLIIAVVNFKRWRAAAEKVALKSATRR
jgi:hypothetical protein